MALEFAYSLDGSGISNIKDFPLDVQNSSAAGYNNGITSCAAPAKKGDLVYLNAGLLRRCYAAASLKAIGIVEGLEFLGLAQGGLYAATNANGGFAVNAQDITKNPNGVGKVRVESDSVYRITASGALAAANVGVSYGVTVNTTTGDQTLNLADTTNAVLKVIDYVGTTAYVTVSGNNTF